MLVFLNRPTGIEVADFSSATFADGHIPDTLRIGYCSKYSRGALMEPYQWFLLGMMAAWTPGLLILAVALCQVDHQPEVGHQSE